MLNFYLSYVLSIGLLGLLLVTNSICLGADKLFCSLLSNVLKADYKRTFLVDWGCSCIISMLRLGVVIVWNLLLGARNLELLLSWNDELSIDEYCKDISLFNFIIFLDELIELMGLPLFDNYFIWGYIFPTHTWSCDFRTPKVFWGI